jgi:hypothetical protein
MEIIRLLEEGKEIINFDESIISGTCNHTCSWEKKGNIPGRAIKRSLSGVALLLAVSSDGVVFFQFMDGINN